MQIGKWLPLLETEKMGKVERCCMLLKTNCQWLSAQMLALVEKVFDCHFKSSGIWELDGPEGPSLPSPCSVHTALLASVDRSIPGSYSVAQQSWETAEEELACFANRRVDLNKLTNIHTSHLWGTAKTNSMLVLARVCLVFRVKLHQPTVKRNIIEILREAVVQGQAQKQEEGDEVEAAEPPPPPLPGLSSLASH